MAFASRRSVIVAFFLLAKRASAGALAAWYTDLGPSLLVQDDETSHVRYSLCTSKNTPILPEDETIIAPLYKYRPRNGTALAGTGWYDSKITWASIFYQDVDDNLVNSYLKCDPNTGYWLSQGDYIISGDAPSVASGTGLAAVLLGSTGGYRVFYHDADNRTIRQIGYTSDTSWHDIGAVTQDASLGNAIGAVYSGKNSNITVAAAMGSQNIEVGQWFDDDSWHISAFPQPLSGDLVTNATNATSIALNTTNVANFTLPAWDGTASSLGVSTHHSGTRSIFYIGTDSALHQATQSGSDAWSMEAPPNATFWPSPDATARGQLAVASDSQNGQLRVYYQSGGQIVELNGDGLEWTIAAAALPNANSSASTTSSSGSGGSSSSGSSSDDNSDGSSASDGSSGGLSTGGKVGVGVGVSMSAVAVVGILGGLFFLRKRQQRRNKESTLGGSTLADGSSMAPTPHTAYSTTAYPNHVSPQTAYPQYGGYDQTAYNQSNGWATYYNQPQVIPKQPGELETGAPAAQELPQNFRYHEMVGEGHYREAP
ncbi:hypothetical protein E8E14_004336 [Neopestalotiopsis sp. 37M]|nr:hypothetical protein E8E14_004336 [Neopestalotiopsis sp. 37M]